MHSHLLTSIPATLLSIAAPVSLSFVVWILALGPTATLLIMTTRALICSVGCRSLSRQTLTRGTTNLVPAAATSKHLSRWSRQVSCIRTFSTDRASKTNNSSSTTTTATPSSTTSPSTANATTPSSSTSTSSWLTRSYEYIKVEQRDKVALVTLHRPKALNALCNALIADLNTALASIDRDPSIAAIVITGSDKAFAAGADIKEMSAQTVTSALTTNMLADWHAVTQLTKPVIAAVNGYALGGGCELALMCDFIVCGDNARFGQPEVTIGTIPGCGGSQRLTRSVGKAKAMDMILTGQPIDAAEAKQCGLVSRVVEVGRTVEEAVRLGNVIGGFSGVAVALAKEAVNVAYETTLQAGVLFERRLFHATFGTADQKEGMAAFMEKRKPTFKNQ